MQNKTTRKRYQWNVSTDNYKEDIEKAKGVWNAVWQRNSNDYHNEMTYTSNRLAKCKVSITKCWLVMEDYMFLHLFWKTDWKHLVTFVIHPLLLLILKRYFKINEINSKVEDAAAVLKKVEEVYGPQAKSTFHLDGFSAEFDNWWFNVRMSNTEPLVRLNLEAKTKALMEEKTEEILDIEDENTIILETIKKTTVNV